MKHGTVAVIVLVSWAVADAQPGVGLWKNFTDMKNVRGVSSRGSGVWVATSGGLFSYDEATGKTAAYTNSDGMSSNDLTAVLVDATGNVWVGSQEGFVDVLEAGRKTVRTLRGIRDSQYIQKAIRSFLMEGDSLLIGTDYGISVFRLSRWEFGDTYANFGFAVQGSVRDLLVHSDQMWVATTQGIATAPRFAVNLSSPTTWTRFQTAQGLPANATTSLALLRDTVVAGTANGGAFWTGTGFQSVPSLSSKQIAALHVVGSQLSVVWNGSGSYTLETLAALSSGSTVVAGNGSGPATALAATQSGTVWVGTSFGGIARWGGAAWEYAVPNGPQSNLFANVAVDDKGVVWSGTGVNGQGRGFSWYNPALTEGTQWKNFTLSAYPVMAYDDYYKVGIAGGRAWISSWGWGVVEVAADTIRRRIFMPTFASSVPAATYPVIGGVRADAAGQIWFVNRTATTGYYLVRLVNDTSFFYYANTISPGQGLFTSLVIDRNGTKWLANAEPFNKPSTGLYYFNENSRVAGTASTGGWGFMTTTDGLPNNTVLSLAVDLNGDVCVGTDLGFMIITDPLFPKQRRFSSFPLREQSIQAIAVDAVNNKWVGTKEGIFVMNPDATQILQHYDVATTEGRLVDNDVRSLAIDQKRGIVYAGTEKGLSSLGIEAVGTVRSFQTLQVGPNPFVMPSSGPMTIQNLEAESVIKILSVDGSVVTEFRAQGGGRAFWDGKDRAGRSVSSGVYFVVAYTENGDHIATAKVAVVRR